VKILVGHETEVCIGGMTVVTGCGTLPSRIQTTTALGIEAGVEARVRFQNQTWKDSGPFIMRPGESMNQWDQSLSIIITIRRREWINIIQIEVGAGVRWHHGNPMSRGLLNPISTVATHNIIRVILKKRVIYF
jgi:hypothetical protein